ncbi:MAG: family 2 glycosyl transferase [Candidatus Peregrinibacteria bacterium GW2011_GWC2_39_14]|nr:MAG: Glycosyl transferase family 2 [Candidatus Peregrinibacteria bacterium GW2011_GWA2_38_36]KKR07071.1 MAG: family 2 glycosyl transferase [Candidatus Peregrinibacteria bacterium GW2011_GWC2_39_14]
MKTFIVIPAYNEAKIVSCAVHDLKIHGYRDIVVVDDGSSDKTFEEAERAGAVAIKHVINCGVGAATQTGIDFALKNGADAIVTFDADCQHSADDIEGLIEPILKRKYDVVIGSRFLNKQKIPFSRRVFNKIGNFLTYLISGIYSTDSQSGIKVFSREAAKKIRITANRFEYCSEIFREIKETRLSFIEVPVKVSYTAYTKLKGQNFAHGLETGFKLIVRSLMR